MVILLQVLQFFSLLCTLIQTAKLRSIKNPYHTWFMIKNELRNAIKTFFHEVFVVEKDVITFDWFLTTIALIQLFEVAILTFKFTVFWIIFVFNWFITFITFKTMLVVIFSFNIDIFSFDYFLTAFTANSKLFLIAFFTIKIIMFFYITL